MVRVTNELTSAKKNELFSFVGHSFGRSFPRNAQLEKVVRVSQRKFIVFIILIIRQREVRYQVTVNEGDNGYSVEDSQFVFNFTPSYQEWTDFESLSDVDSLVRQAMPSRLPSGYRLSRVERDDPYFRFYYTFGLSKYQCEFTFDPFARKVFLVNIKSETVSEPVVIREPVVVR